MEQQNEFNLTAKDILGATGISRFRLHQLMYGSSQKQSSTRKSAEVNEPKKIYTYAPLLVEGVHFRYVRTRIYFHQTAINIIKNRKGKQ